MKRIIVWVLALIPDHLQHEADGLLDVPLHDLRVLIQILQGSEFVVCGTY